MKRIFFVAIAALLALSCNLQADAKKKEVCF